jgi:hypothetical protein
MSGDVVVPRTRIAEFINIPTPCRSSSTSGSGASATPETATLHLYILRDPFPKDEWESEVDAVF